MYRVGMIGGKYLPLTQGHIDSIIKAYTMCKELYIVLSYNETREKLLFKNSAMKPISPKERHKWLFQATCDLENIHIIDVEDDATNEHEYDWEKGANDIKREIGKHIDVVFHSDVENRELFKMLYPNSDVVTFDRLETPISATMLRHDSDIYKLWEYVPNVARPYFTKKVCIIGTESCAKSTLVKLLAKHYNTSYVKEVGRDVCYDVGGAENMQTSDYYDIAMKHKQEELCRLEMANKVLFVDTEALVTKYYLNLYTDDNNESMLFDAISNINNYDLYIFLEPDVTWVQDGTRLHGEHEVRDENNAKIKNIFDEKGIKYITVSGSYSDRLSKAISLVNDLIGL